MSIVHSLDSYIHHCIFPLSNASCLQYQRHRVEFDAKKERKAKESHSLEITIKKIMRKINFFKKNHCTCEQSNYFLVSLEDQHYAACTLEHAQNSLPLKLCAV